MATGRGGRQEDTSVPVLLEMSNALAPPVPHPPFLSFTMRHALVLLTIAVLACPSICVSAGSLSSDAEFLAAVVEHVPLSMRNSPPVSREEALQVMFSNLDMYASHMERASQQGARIIVFPEDGLYGSELESRDGALPYLEPLPTVPPGSPGIAVPCTPDSATPTPVLTRVSCLATQHNLTVVLNMGDLVSCAATASGCPPDGRFQFNTQVAVSEKGVLLAKYHKTHLFPEDLLYFDRPPSPEMAYFDTSFGVRFGMFICFDIFFQFPSVALVQELGITHFVYSTYWVNTGTVPLITAIQMQQAWSRANHAALLASNIGYGYEDSGSGVYVAGRAIKHIFLPRLNQTGDNLLVAPVPKQLSTQGGAKRLEYGHLSSLQGTGDDTPSVPSNATLVLLSDAFTSVSALYTSWDGHRVSCHLEAEFLQAPDLGYALMAYRGPWFDGLLEGTVCALVRCPSKDGRPSSCLSLTMDTDVAISSLHLHAQFPVGDPLGTVLPIVGTQEGEIVVEGPAFSVDSEARTADLSLGKMGDRASNPIRVVNVVLFQEWG